MISQNLISINQQIRELEHRYQRNPNSVKLLAVTKTQPVEIIQRAIDAGQTAFGENYLQEALLKIELFKSHALEWHFIGPIQSNKTHKIAEHFSWVHTVASEKIAQRLNDARPDTLPPLNICLQINISAEKTKAGVDATQLFSLLEFCADLPQIKLRGLMAIPATSNTLPAQREPFHQLKILFDKANTLGYQLDTLSMGMSGDVTAAIAEGSTIVRIGTAIFGKRT